MSSKEFQAPTIFRNIQRESSIPQNHNGFNLLIDPRLQRRHTQTVSMRRLFLVIIFISCLSGGYGFYRLNNGDAFNAVFFTLGIMGIGMSFARQKTESEPTPESDSVNPPSH